MARHSRPLAAKKWAEEIVYAVTDLPAEAAAANEIAVWVRDRRKIESFAHWIRYVAFGEDARTILTRSTPPS